MKNRGKYLNEQDKIDYDEIGYVIKRNFFSKEEIDKVYNTAINDGVLQEKTYGRADSQGHKTNLALWYSLEDNIYSQLVRSKRIVNSVELLLRGEACHFHTKLMQKEPHVGGAWEWHQDYGYWYNDGFLFPDMISVMTALTRSNKENGCLQVIPGSHKIGRINHGMAGGQKGADLEKVKVAESRLGIVFAEMEPGDTLFFHSNLLHRSNMNSSDYARWSIITAYNKYGNSPYKNNFELANTPIEAVPDDAILKSEIKGVSEATDFLTK